jgi:tRNA(His) guanylyltransferase
MSKSIYEYVRSYEQSNDNQLLKDCFIVVRVDGQGFHQFSKKHDFKKPNDKRFVI